MKQLRFVAIQNEEDGSRDGEEGWKVFIDDAEVCMVDNDEMDVSDTALDPIWAALGVEIKFDFD